MSSWQQVGDNEWVVHVGDPRDESAKVVVYMDSFVAETLAATVTAKVGLETGPDAETGQVEQFDPGLATLSLIERAVKIE